MRKLLTFVIRGIVYSSVLISIYLPRAASGQMWIQTGNMTIERSGLTATLLSNGQVLVTGGKRGAPNTHLASAELYNLVNGTFTSTGSMNTARNRPTATLILNSNTPLDGQALIVGGETTDPGGFLASAELYNPATGMFNFTGSMATRREQHAAVLLQNGKILVLGGEDNSHAALNTAELYDPAIGTFTPTANTMTTPRREFPRATRLADGRVLVTGGELFNNGPILDSAEIYNPTTNMFTVTGSMTVARVGHTSTLPPDGQVLMTLLQNSELTPCRCNTKL